MRPPYIHKDGSPNYDHPGFGRDNPCHRLHMDCEGDCGKCPNKDFFRHVDLARAIQADHLIIKVTVRFR